MHVEVCLRIKKEYAELLKEGVSYEIIAFGNIRSYKSVILWAMVLFSPLAYPRYDWMSMAVSELSAVGAPSRELAAQLNSLFSLCAVVSIMAVCVAVRNCKEKLLRRGVYLLAVMEWLCTVGYGCFARISDAQATNIQNIIHILVTVFMVLLSIVSLIMIFLGTRKSNLKSLGIWSGVCLCVMFVGAIGTNVFLKTVFGIFERMSTFSAVIFNAVLGWCLYTGQFLQEESENL